MAGVVYEHLKAEANRAAREGRGPYFTDHREISTDGDGSHTVIEKGRVLYHGSDWRAADRVQELGVSPERQAAAHQFKPAGQLSNQEIVREARDLHAHFEQLAQRYEQAPPAQRAEIREEMQPYVNRERELRQEYTGRISPEISQDRVPDQQIGYSR